MKKQVTPGETPAKITVSMIDQDLKDGISKSEMVKKYNIKPWEVDEMFKHPFLKGRRPSRKKALSFSFVDDTLPLNSGDIAVEQAEEVNPNQVTLEDAIDEAIESVEEVKDQMQETQEAIIDMLSPTPFHSPEEEVIEKLTTNSEDDYDDGEDDEYISDAKEIDLDDETDDSFEL